MTPSTTSGLEEEGGSAVEFSEGEGEGEGEGLDEGKAMLRVGYGGVRRGEEEEEYIQDWKENGGPKR